MYNNMENVLQAVNSKYISLSEEETKCNNEILDSVVNTFLAELKKDDLFCTLFERVFYGGSYYDDLRVGRPNEFDLDLLLRIPKRKVNPELLLSDIPGYLVLKVKQPNGLGPTFMKLVDSGGYLMNNKVRQWIEGLIVKAMNNLSYGRGVCQVTANYKQYRVRMTKSGPAMTLHLDELSIDIDLVPCFIFSAGDWPAGGYTPNPTPQKPDFFIVPKLPKRNRPAGGHTRNPIPQKPKTVIVPKLPKRELYDGKYWRMSFQEQERVLIKSKQFLKPSLKLLKKLRDAQGHHVIASYYIKTIFLWETVKNDSTFWNDNLSNTFLKMFRKYIEYLGRHEIPYFWNKRNNLLAGISPATITNFTNRLRCIYQDIEKSTDPFAVCIYLGTPITREEAAEAAKRSLCSLS